MYIINKIDISIFLFLLIITVSPYIIHITSKLLLSISETLKIKISITRLLKFRGQI